MARILLGNNNFSLFSLLSNSRSLHALHQTRRRLQTLAYEVIQHSLSKPPSSTAFIIHGLLGFGRNWRSFSKNLLSVLTDSSPSSNWRIILVDLRCHGKSADLRDLSPPHDLANATKDLADLVKHQGWTWPDVLIGHSLGGKVALQFLEDCMNEKYGSAMLPKQLWVLDSPPGKVNSGDSAGEVPKVLETLQNLSSPIPSQKWLVDHMLSLGFSKTLSQWLGSNLKSQGEYKSWVFNLEGVVKVFESYRKKEYWRVLEQAPKGCEINMVRAEKSDRWEGCVKERLERVADESEGKVRVFVLPNAGHWLHVDNPTGLLHILAPRLASISSLT